MIVYSQNYFLFLCESDSKFFTMKTVLIRQPLILVYIVKLNTYEEIGLGKEMSYSVIFFCMKKGDSFLAFTNVKSEVV